MCVRLVTYFTTQKIPVEKKKRRHEYTRTQGEEPLSKSWKDFQCIYNLASISRQEEEEWPGFSSHTTPSCSSFSLSLNLPGEEKRIKMENEREGKMEDVRFRFCPPSQTLLT